METPAEQLTNDPKLNGEEEPAEEPKTEEPASEPADEPASE